MAQKITPSFLIPHSNFLITLKAWPVIAGATIGLSFLTQEVAAWCGIALPEQTNVELVKRCLSSAFVSAKAFGVAAFLVVQVLILMPAIEELVFRYFLVMLPKRVLDKRHETGNMTWWGLAGISSLLFSAAHYITQPWPDNAFLALFFFGLAQCWLYRKTMRLWCAMLNHALFNLTNLILLFVV